MDIISKLVRFAMMTHYLAKGGGVRGGWAGAQAEPRLFTLRPQAGAEGEKGHGACFRHIRQSLCSSQHIVSRASLTNFNPLLAASEAHHLTLLALLRLPVLHAGPSSCLSSPRKLYFERPAVKLARGFLFLCLLLPYPFVEPQTALVACCRARAGRKRRWSSSRTQLAVQTRVSGNPEPCCVFLSSCRAKHLPEQFQNAVGSRLDSLLHHPVQALLPEQVIDRTPKALNPDLSSCFSCRAMQLPEQSRKLLADQDLVFR
jgi:hypothetical protein